MYMLHYHVHRFLETLSRPRAWHPEGHAQFVVFGHKRQIFFQAEDNSRRKRANFIFSPKAVSVLRWLGNNARFIQ
jgi:hypothetical protein